MSDLSPLSGGERKSRLRAVRSVLTPPDVSRGVSYFALLSGEMVEAELFVPCGISNFA
jgi:hypothetical protein